MPYIRRDESTRQRFRNENWVAIRNRCEKLFLCLMQFNYCLELVAIYVYSYIYNKKKQYVVLSRFWMGEGYKVNL